MGGFIGSTTSHLEAVFPIILRLVLELVESPLLYSFQELYFFRCSRTSILIGITIRVKMQFLLFSLDIGQKVLKSYILHCLPVRLVVVTGFEPATAHQSSAYERYKLSALPLSYTTKLNASCWSRPSDLSVINTLLYQLS